jgi:predicted methyltransferase
MRAALTAMAAMALIAAPAFAQPSGSVVPPKEPEQQIEPCQICAVERLDLPQRIDRALKAADRSMEHRLRDENRQVRRIIETAWPTLLPLTGARVLDVASGGGYLAMIYSTLVGPGGHVDMHNTPGWIAQFPAMELERQKAGITRKNVGWITLPWHTLTAPADSYDVIVLGQVWHDVILEGGDYLQLAERLFAMLKPGGRLVVEDHDAIPEMDLGRQAYLHRISHGDTTGHFLRAGFTLQEMVLIESEHDTRTFNVFQPTVRHRTDRFIAVFEKPAN